MTMSTETPRVTLTQADVERLLAHPDGDTRADAAAKVAVAFESGQLSDKERQIGESIFRIMVKDAEVRVRAALSHYLKSAGDLPHDVALALATDVDAVALPMLEFSQALTENDLVELVYAHGAAGQTAIARRAHVTAPVADALVEHGDAAVVTTLMRNQGAEITEPALRKTIARHGDSETVQEAVADRPQLPVTIAERLVALVSDKLRDHLVAQHKLPADKVAALIHRSRERATATLLPPGLDPQVDLQRLIEHLHVNRRLTPTLILRTLCLGDVGFLEQSLARLSGAPLVNAQVLIHDAGDLGFKAIYKRAKLPPDLYPAFRVALEVARETRRDVGDAPDPEFVRRSLERVLTTEDIADADADYLVKKLEDYATL